jgi:putative membrane protein
MFLLIRWILHAVALFVVAYFVPGFHIGSIPAALLAALVIGLLNSTLGLLLKIVTLPLAVLTLGLFFLVINAFILILAGHIVPGFYVASFGSAFVGACFLALLHLIIHVLTPGRSKQRRENTV